MLVGQLDPFLMVSMRRVEKQHGSELELSHDGPELESNGLG